MVQDNPKQEELQEMIKFIAQNKQIYIYMGDIILAKNISKYLYYARIQFCGFIKPEIYDCDRDSEPMPIINYAELMKLSKSEKRNTGVIIATANELYNQVIDTLHQIGIHHTYLVSDWNKWALVRKMAPRNIDEFYLEVNLADHCNLNCQCCDHFSPIAKKTFLDFEQYVRDIHRISELSGGKIGLMKLQGGEPLLNPRVTEYMKATREVFPDSPICLFTDGLLLPKVGERNDDNFWDAVRRYEIEVRMTRYPIPLDIERITQQAERHGVPVTFDPPVCKGGARLWIFSEIGALDYHGIKHSVKHPFDLSGLQEKWRWVSCYQFNESQVLRDGKVYTCPMIPYAHFFNEKFNVNLEVKEDCFIDIYKAKTMEEITEFCTHRTSFCDYCAVHHRSVLEWKQSSHDISEWTL